MRAAMTAGKPDRSLLTFAPANKNVPNPPLGGFFIFNARKPGNG